MKQILRKAKQATDSNKEEQGQDGEIGFWALHDYSFYTNLMSTKRGECTCAPEPNDHTIWDGVIAVKCRQSDSLCADDVSTLFSAASILRRSVAMSRL